MALEPGTRLGTYEILAVLGAGGMGVVYKARDVKLRRDVAIKVLPADLTADPERRARLLREARAAAAVNHPNIATIHEVNEIEGSIFIAMELIEGRTLRSLVRSGPLPIKEAVPLAIEMSEGLAHAHESGVIHRDLKPENIIVRSDRHPKILDFGLAKVRPPQQTLRTGMSEAETETGELTRHGRILGTPAYMSPEQARGESVDSRSDVFSFGITLYEMVTGKNPFQGKTPIDTLAAIINHEVAPASRLNAEVSPDLDRILRRCLEKDPGRRFQDTGKLRDELRHLQGDPVRRMSNGRSWRIAGVALLLLAAIGAAVVSRPWRDRGAIEVKASIRESKGPSIAVIPFSNSSGDPEQDYFGDGLTEDIISALSRYRELSVLARSSTVRYKDVEEDIREIGAALGAQYVLQGSVRKAGDRIRVSVQLSNTSEGRSVWGEKYERDLTTQDLFALQDELTEQVVNAIADAYGVLTQAELPGTRRTPPARFDSYDCVLRTYEYLQAHNPENHLAARNCMEYVVRLEPDYAEAQAWLAYLFAEEHHHHRNERPDRYVALDRALEGAKEAVRLDDASQVAHGALALTYFLRGELELGRIEAYRTIERGPSNAIWLLVIGTYLAQVEDFEGGLPMVQRAVALSPVRDRVLRATWPVR